MKTRLDILTEIEKYTDTILAYHISAEESKNDFWSAEFEEKNEDIVFDKHFVEKLYKQGKE